MRASASASASTPASASVSASGPAGAADADADADACTRTRTGFLRVQPLQPCFHVRSTCFQTPGPGTRRCLLSTGVCLFVRLPVCLCCVSESQTTRLVGCSRLGTHAEPKRYSTRRGRRRSFGLWALSLGLSRPMAQMRLCFKCAVIRERAGAPTWPQHRALMPQILPSAFLIRSPR